MLEDAQYWLTSGYLADRPHPKTGATALHVAAAKGYIKVMRCVWLCVCFCLGVVFVVVVKVFVWF